METNEALRSSSQVRQKLKQAMFRHLQQELQDNFKATPEGCSHNHFTPIGGSPERVGICRFDGTTPEGVLSPRGGVCDARVTGCLVQAHACKCWAALYSKEKIKGDFRNLMASDRGMIAARYPDVAALMWVLDGVDFAEELRMAEEEADPESIEAT